jgi:hypothetical protein
MTTFFQYLDWGFGNKDSAFSRDMWRLVGSDDGFEYICELLQ